MQTKRRLFPETKLIALAAVLLLAAGFALSGCGGGGSANQVSVSVTGTASVLVPTQSETITATVTGATDQTVTFSCEVFTTANPTTATPNPQPVDKGACTSDVGTLSNQVISSTASSTVTFTAPAKFPDQTTFPNVAVHVIATSKANAKKTGFFKITFDSGIRIVISPSTATLATGEQTAFQALDLNNNVLDPSTFTWGVTFETTGIVDSVSCSGGSNDCGSVKTSGLFEVYTAPASVPKASTVTSPAQNAAGIVTLFAFSNTDNSRIAQATITIVQGGPITFNSISPTIVPQGSAQADIFLSAPNITSQTPINLSGACVPGGGTQEVNESQVKVVFSTGSTVAAIGARVRLFDTAQVPQLANAGACQISLVQSGTNTVTGGPFTLNIVPVRPSMVGLSLDNLSESATATNYFLAQTPPLAVDGGYFGSSGNLISVKFQGQTLIPQSPTARRLPVNFSGVNVATGGHTAGLFTLSVTNPLLSPAASGFANVAIIPDYANTNPPTTLAPIPLSGTGVTPSAVAIDSALRLAVVADANPANANNIQLVSVPVGAPPTVAGTASSGGSIATSVAIDDGTVVLSGGPKQLHRAVIVNYASRTLSILDLQTNTLVAPPIDLSNNGALIPGGVAQPFPYAVGVDPFLHRAVVAFAPASGTGTNIGLLVNLFDQTTTSPAGTNPPCVFGAPPYCPIEYLSLGTGAHPQAAFEPGAHRVYVTPGGGGSVASVDLSAAPLSPVAISSLTRTTSTLVTVTTASTLTLNPSNPGTVLITGSKVGDFAGAFPVQSILSSTSFTYLQSGTSGETISCPGDLASCEITEGTSPTFFIVSPTIQGIAVNPVTRQLVLADPNVTQGQIDFLNPLNQGITSMTLFTGAVGSTNTGAPELGDTNTAFQPFTNTAVVFNPTGSFNQISLIDPALRQRLFLINTGQTGTGSVCVSGCGGASAVNLSIPGALVVDPVTNQAIAANSGSGSLTVVQLGSIRPVQIQEVRTPVVPSAPLLQRAILVPSDPNLGPQPVDVPGVDIFGTGFDAGSVVRLDGTPLPGGDVSFVNSTHLVATIPATALTNLPRRFALDVVSSTGVSSNAMDLSAIVSIALPNCGTGGGTAPVPGGVAIDDQRGIALVTETACNVLAKVNLNSGQSFAVVSTMPTGQNPTDVAVIPSLTPTLGVAVVTNHDANTVSILDEDHGTQVVSDVAVGTNPTGVAADPQTDFAIIANTGSNSATGIDLTPLTANPIGKLAPTSAPTDQNPIAVALDPDRGTNARGLAAVTALTPGTGATPPEGVIDAIDIGNATPVKSATAQAPFLSSQTPTDITFDPVAVTGTTNPGLFYVVMSDSNQMLAYNPDSGTAGPVQVGINPNSVATNPQSSTILTLNAISNTSTIIDSQTFTTRDTIGIGASGRFAAAISQIKNFAVISDQSNNRILLFPLP